MVGSLVRDETPLVASETLPFFRDVYDHTIQVIETSETPRDMVTGMLDVYMSSMGMRINEIMEVLTMLSSIFIPLTFVVGIYGQNFEFLPELKWKYAYPVEWGLNILIVVGMLSYFKRKRWI